MIISEMHHRVTYMYVNFQQHRVSRSIKIVHTNLFANKRKLHKICNLQFEFRESASFRHASTDFLYFSQS